MKIFFVSMWSRRLSGPRAFRSTRRTATVTMSAPDASCAARMTAKLGYLPVPTRSRERNARPASTNASLMPSILARALGGPVHDARALLLAGGGVDDRLDLGDGVRGEATLLGVLPDHLRI